MIYFPRIYFLSSFYFFRIVFCPLVSGVNVESGLGWWCGQLLLPGGASSQLIPGLWLVSASNPGIWLVDTRCQAPADRRPVQQGSPLSSVAPGPSPKSPQYRFEQQGSGQPCLAQPPVPAQGRGEGRPQSAGGLRREHSHQDKRDDEKLCRLFFATLGA